MKKCFSFLLATLFCLLSVPVFSAAATVPDPACTGAVMLDAETGTVLFQSNPEETVSVGPLALLFNGFTLLSASSLPETVTPEKSVGAFKKGTEYSVESLLAAALVGADSDAGAVLAAQNETIVQARTEILDRLALSATVLSGPTASDSDSVTSAYDLALLIGAGLKNDRFSGYLKVRSYTFNNNGNASVYNNSCAFFTGGSVAFCTGGFSAKTGASRSGVCLVEQGNQHLILAVLGAKSEEALTSAFASLAAYGLSEFRNVSIPSSLLEETELPVLSGGVIIAHKTVRIPEGTLLTVSEPFEEGTVFLSSSLPQYLSAEDEEIPVTVSAKNADGETVLLGTLRLNAAPLDVTPTVAPGGTKIVKRTFWQKLGSVLLTVLKVLGWILVGILAFVLIALIVSAVQRKKRADAIRLRKRAEQNENKQIYYNEDEE